MSDNRWPCKLGTVPTVVWLHGTDAKTLAPGKRVRIKEHVGGRWSVVTITRVDPDGYFMADR